MTDNHQSKQRAQSTCTIFCWSFLSPTVELFSFYKMSKCRLHFKFVLIAWTDGDLWCGGWDVQIGAALSPLENKAKLLGSHPGKVSSISPLKPAHLAEEGNFWYFKWTASKSKQILKYTSLRKVKTLFLSCRESVSSDKLYHFNWFLSVFIVGLSVLTEAQEILSNPTVSQKKISLLRHS